MWAITRAVTGGFFARGASPRIVWARLVGTGGTTTIRGDQLQSALGAYDRWMTFRKVGDSSAGGVAR